LGTTKALDDIRASSSSPNIILASYWLIGSIILLFTILARVFENSKLVTGFGDTTLTGPLIEELMIE
jgi:hypothetical protein